MPTAMDRRPRIGAALAFSLAGFLVPAAWFGPTIARSLDWIAFVLYIGLPSLAAATAGAIFGQPLLDPTQCRSGRAAALRGAGIATTALVLYAPLFAGFFAWTEPGRASVLGLTVMVLWFSFLAVWWSVAAVGAAVGWLLHRRAVRGARAAP